MTSYTINAGQRNGRPYQLDVIADNGAKTTQFFDTLEALALAACNAKHPRERYDIASYYYATTPRTNHWVQTHLRAFSFRGKELDVLALCAWGGQHRYRYRSRYLVGYIRRQGPVPGIGGYRGGPSYKNCRSTAERRLNAAWLPEEGEPETRACRRDNYLYHSWDGRPRPTQRCWKEQRRGRKSWDR